MRRCWYMDSADLIAHETLTLSRPLVHTGDLRNVTIRLAADFVPFPTEGAAPLRWCVYMKDPNGAKVENVQILGHPDPTYLPRWNDTADLSPGIPAGLGGMLMHRATGCTVRGVKVTGLPGVAVQLNGATMCGVSDVVTDRTLMGLRIGPDQTSNNVIVDRVTVGDTWEPLLPGYSGKGQSLKYPGARTGGVCFAAANTTMLTLRDVVTVWGSEGKGIKLNSMKWAFVADCQVPGLQVQGEWAGDPPGQTSHGIAIQGCSIKRKRTYRETEPTDANGIHIHGGATSVWVKDSTIESDGGGGMGIWNDASEVNVTGCKIGGWNGERGGRLGHAIAAVNCGVIQNLATVEADNTFDNQDRLVLVEP